MIWAATRGRTHVETLHGTSIAAAEAQCPDESLAGIARVRRERRARAGDRRAMLFHTYLFIFAFLPATLVAFFLAAKVSKRLPIFILIAASLIFYAYWMPSVTLLLVGSIVFNYFAGALPAGRRSRKPVRRLAIIAAIAIDLGLLGVLQVRQLLPGHGEALTGLGPGPLDIILPIGISFFTFTQIAYLVDAWQRRGEGVRLVPTTCCSSPSSRT